jgi:hypothetical protein
MSNEDREYISRREAQERAAAKKAQTLAARRVHQQMAQLYAAMLQELILIDPVPSLRGCGAL